MCKWISYKSKQRIIQYEQEQKEYNRQRIEEEEKYHHRQQVQQQQKKRKMKEQENERQQHKQQVLHYEEQLNELNDMIVKVKLNNNNKMLQIQSYYMQYKAALRIQLFYKNYRRTNKKVERFKSSTAFSFQKRHFIYRKQ